MQGQKLAQCKHRLLYAPFMHPKSIAPNYSTAHEGWFGVPSPAKAKDLNPIHCTNVQRQ